MMRFEILTLGLETFTRAPQNLSIQDLLAMIHNYWHIVSSGLLLTLTIDITYTYVYVCIYIYMLSVHCFINFFGTCGYVLIDRRRHTPGDQDINSQASSKE